MSVGIPKMMKSSEPSKNSNALPGVNRKKIGIIIVCLSCLCLIPLYSTMYLKANNTVVGPLHKARNGTVDSATSKFLVNNLIELGDTFLTNMVPPPSSLCSEDEFPEQFVLETANRTQEGDSVVLEACAQNILTVTAVGKDGQNVTCEPWVDIYGRIIGPDLATYPKAKQYNLYFNKVEVSNIQGGNFEVRIPPLESGKYRLEILLVHKGASRELVYNTLKRVPCLDEPLVNTPASILLVDTGKCATLPNATALCSEGDVPGRWVTLPRTGCDGIHCEGNINVLASSNRVWAPYRCHYKLYNPQETKQCVAGKNILFIGDSITEELTNELMQIYYFRPNKPPLMKSGLVKEKAWVGRPTHWTKPATDGGRIGFSFVMATPLGCGISCVVGKSDSKLQQLLAPHGKIDLLVLLTGLHDACPRRKPEFFDVFGVYQSKLGPFEAKLRKLMANDGKIIWINSPEGSDRSRCDYLSKPRLTLMNGLTKNFLSTKEDISLLNYFEISGSCYCGNIHKGIRFYKSSSAVKSYNGFVSRMVAHIILNMYCNRRP